MPDFGLTERSQSISAGRGSIPFAIVQLGRFVHDRADHELTTRHLDIADLTNAAIAQRYLTNMLNVVRVHAPIAAYPVRTVGIKRIFCSIRVPSIHIEQSD